MPTAWNGAILSRQISCSGNLYPGQGPAQYVLYGGKELNNENFAQTGYEQRLGELSSGKEMVHAIESAGIGTSRDKGQNWKYRKSGVSNVPNTMIDTDNVR